MSVNTTIEITELIFFISFCLLQKMGVKLGVDFTEGAL
jgi:hypothetical protein